MWHLPYLQSGKGEDKRGIYKVTNVHLRKGHRIHKHTTALGFFFDNCTRNGPSTTSLSIIYSEIFYFIIVWTKASKGLDYVLPVPRCTHAHKYTLTKDPFFSGNIMPFSCIGGLYRRFLISLFVLTTGRQANGWYNRRNSCDKVWFEHERDICMEEKLGHGERESVCVWNLYQTKVDYDSNYYSIFYSVGFAQVSTVINEWTRFHLQR